MRSIAHELPGTWRVTSLRHYLDKAFSGGTPSRSTNEYFKDGLIPWIKSGELNLTTINSTEELITEEGLKKSSARLVEPNTLLYALYGATAGIPAFTKIKAALNQAVLAIIPKNNKLDKYFLYYLLLFKREDILRRFTQGAQPNLSATLVKNLKVAIPPLPEQQKIAAILRTWDEAIQKCEQTIATLKTRNKGLAQQLLSGKKRLKGFEGEWEEVKANKLFKNHSDKTHGGKLEVLSATQERGVIPRSMNNIDIKYDPKSLGNYKKVEVGDYVISLRSFQGGIEYSYYEGIVSPAYTVLKEVLPISKTFYRLFFKTENFINRLNTIIYGIRDGKQISYKEFSTLKLPYPPVEEQHAIAKILEEADHELQLYQQKLTTLKDQKKGLMQKLLTGEVRVKI